jgi:hypothetical protein
MAKTDVAIEVVARAILGVPVGGQLPPTAVLARTAQVGNGTIQAALRALEDAGAVSFTAHGASGRSLVARDLTALWSASGRGALTGVLPLPESREFAGLATGLAALAERHDLPFQLLFRQGSRVRLKFLESERVDFVVFSGQVAQSVTADVAGWVLGAHTYYRRNAVAVITAAGRDVNPRGRVPIDQNSSDHVSLTLQEFPDAKLVDTPYLFIPELIVRGELDAAVWHQTSSSHLLTASGLSIHPLSSGANVAPGGDSELDKAAIVWRRSDVGAGQLLEEVFKVPELEQIQREVIDGRRIPQF